MTGLAKVGLGIVAFFGVLVFAGTFAYLSDPPAKPAPPTFTVQATRLVHALAANDPVGFCPHLPRAAFAANGWKTMRDCLKGSRSPFASYTVALLHITRTSATTGRVRILAGGAHFFLYLERQHRVWILTNYECLTCGTPGAGVPAVEP